MPNIGLNADSVCAVVSVVDFQSAQTWYSTLFGRAPDLVPVDGVAEWKLAENAWLQLGEDPERAGKSTVVIGVRDLAEQLEAVRAAGFAPGEIETIPGLIRMSTILDPEGNAVNFFEEL
ncbi:VOC family protein [Saccharopolyspora sp. CA-218241]|uniref:VOC family protein n=1 Tax=Saccharopolyspora sp. CA-218241 TaxID=3240027 RepID=UPI003D98C09B